MKGVDCLVLPLIAVAMVVGVLTAPLPDIYHDCVRHGGMLPVDPGLRFCIDNRRIVHYLPPKGGVIHENVIRTRRVDLGSDGR